MRSFNLVDRLIVQLNKLEAQDKLNHSYGANYDDPRLQAAIRALERKIRREVRKFTPAEIDEHFGVEEPPF